MNNNQRYAFQPISDGRELKLIIQSYGPVTIADAERLIRDLTTTLVSFAELADCDAIEIDPCVGLDGNGTVTDYMSAGTMERYPASDAGSLRADIACWTVYGHRTDGGSVALLDFPTRDGAFVAAELLRPFVGRLVG
jgi:hypothetical protein